MARLRKTSCGSDSLLVGAAHRLLLSFLSTSLPPWARARLAYERNADAGGYWPRLPVNARREENRSRAVGG